MKTGSLLQDIIGSIVSPLGRFGDMAVERSVEDLCHDLLSSRGEVSGRRIGATILKKYHAMDADQKAGFFIFLTEQLDLDADAVARAAGKYSEEKSPQNLAQLLTSAEPPRQELLRRLNQVPGATQALVKMRSDLLAQIGNEPSLKRLDLDFEHLLGSWFNMGFLELRKISWDSSASVLAKIIQYEAVHAINDWDDLQRRLQPGDRRCFAFFHPSMPQEPLVFVEIALCKGIPNSIQSLLHEGRELLDEDQADTAVFYSISNCQTGLRGVSFGNSLIKQVASGLSQELPNLKNFVTLSPMPGLSKWIENNPDDVSEQVVTSLMQLDIEISDENPVSMNSELESDLNIAAARYLLNAKRSDGLPVDPVARFHLGNGASISGIHSMADTSSKGVAQSFSVMVNYLYDMAKIETQHEDFASNKIVHSSKELKNLAKSKMVNHTTFEKAG